VLVSEEFAAAADDQFERVGTFDLKGVALPQPVFAPSVGRHPLHVRLSLPRNARVNPPALVDVHQGARLSDRGLIWARGRSEYLAMAQMSLREWTEGWGVVRRVHEKLEFIAFFEAQEDAQAAAVEAGIDCQVCWVTYRDGVGFRLNEDNGED
jgi:hypothetical protein